MTLREPMSRCNTASSSTTHSVGGLGRSRIACRAEWAIEKAAAALEGAKVLLSAAPPERFS
jgi:hypothetical protein